MTEISDPDKIRCRTCGGPAWVYCMISEEAWRDISYHFNKQGHLCLYCMDKALRAAGYADCTVPLTVTSGPMMHPMFRNTVKGRATDEA